MEQNKAQTSLQTHSLTSPSPCFSLSKSRDEDSTPQSAAPTPPPRLWRPAAQRNLRNQWSNLASLRQQWSSSSSTARSHATSLVNAFLSQRYMKDMELGVLSDMPNIRIKACWKLFKQQVVIIANMVNASTSLRCFRKGTDSSTLVQFSCSSENINDNGDGGGIPVFKFWSISSFEKLASELVQMFELEVNVKRLLVMELVSLSNKEFPKMKAFCWSDELYPGEFNDLSYCNLYSREACEPVPPKLEGSMSDTPSTLSHHQLDSDVLQVYLTTWLVDVNVDKYRVEEILSVVSEEMDVNFS